AAALAEQAAAALAVATATAAAVAPAAAAVAATAAVAAAAAVATAAAERGRLTRAGERHHEDNTVHWVNLLQIMETSQPTRQVRTTSLPGAVVGKLVKLRKIAKMRE